MGSTSLYKLESIKTRLNPLWIQPPHLTLNKVEFGVRPMQPQFDTGGVRLGRPTATLF